MALLTRGARVLVLPGTAVVHPPQQTDHEVPHQPSGVHHDLPAAPARPSAPAKNQEGTLATPATTRPAVNKSQTPLTPARRKVGHDIVGGIFLFQFW